MQIVGHVIARMYVSAIVLLLFLAGASAYLLDEFPYALIFTVFACAIIEMALRKYYLKQNFKIPFSGIITGLIIGCVAPINVPLIPVFVACAIAMCSKFLIKIKSSNVFNPAALGLFGLGLLSIGSSWWATTSITVYGFAVSLSIVLVIAAYECRRLTLAFSFIAASVLFSILVSLPLTLGSVEIALISVNYFFAFLMLTEPKTSPPKRIAQMLYGIYVAVVYFILLLVLPHSLYLSYLTIFAALLIGNMTYALYRKLDGLNGLTRLFSSKAVA